MLRDIRHGLRIIWRQPGFALAAILTLALGLGANTAIFTVAWQLMLKPLPYPHADRLVEVWETYDKTNPANINPVAPVFYHRWLRDADAFDALAAYSYFQPSASLTGGGEPEQLVMRNVTGAYFPRVRDDTARSAACWATRTRRPTAATSSSRKDSGGVALARTRTSSGARFVSSTSPASSSA